MNGIEPILNCISKGAVLFASVSGGKDGQAMTKTLVNNKLPVACMVHADLGRIEWYESLPMCQQQSDELNIPLYVVRRSDGLGLVEYWKRRMNKLKDLFIPFWSSSKNRYCTSDTKRGPIDKFIRAYDSNFIISCEGIRAEESTARGKKDPLTIRKGVTSSYYDGMTVEEAIANYNPEKRLVLTWYPIFNFTIHEVWATYGVDQIDLDSFRRIYLQYNYVHHRWPFHPAYVYGNDRVSCVFCVLGSMNDLKVGAKHRPELLAELIDMEVEGKATFRHNWSLKNLLN